MNHGTSSTRREFLKTATGAAVTGVFAAPYIITSKALGDDTTPPASDRIVMGGIGIGNQGGGDQGAFLGRGDVQYVAVCDVRKKWRDGAKDRVNGRNKNSDCAAYNDFRELLARDDIDAVHIGTPDHWHAIMVIEACRAGKDAYCQKPETLTLREGPLMIAAARRYSRIVSGGSQRVREDFNNLVGPCWNGELGAIKSVNVRDFGPLSQLCNLPAQETPADIDWEMWLGPAPWQPYNSGRCDGNFGTGGNSWRSYVDYSGGSLTDWGAHLFGGATFASDVCELQPTAAVFHKADGQLGAYVTLTYPNGLEIHHRRPDQLKPEGPQIDGGKIQIHGDGVKRDPKPAPGYKGGGGIHGDFIHCVKTREKPFRDIELGVNTMVALHLLTIAYRLQRTVKWDAATQQFPSDEEAGRMVDRARRQPWFLS